MGQISNIIDGWSNYLKGMTGLRENERAKICKKCAYAKVGTFERWLPSKGLEEVKGLKCSKCTCPLVAKIRSINDECPIGKW